VTLLHTCWLETLTAPNRPREGFLSRYFETVAGVQCVIKSGGDWDQCRIVQEKVEREERSIYV
jgi:hypothetical protein